MCGFDRVLTCRSPEDTCRVDADCDTTDECVLEDGDATHLTCDDQTSMSDC